MPDPTKLTVVVNIVRLGKESCLAVTTLGGVTLRGERSPTPFDAIRSLFRGLSGSPDVSSHQDSAIALDMALAGTSLAQIGEGAVSSSASADEDRTEVES